MYFIFKCEGGEALKEDGLMKTVAAFHQTVTEDHYRENIRVLVTDNETAERERLCSTVSHC